MSDYTAERPNNWRELQTLITVPPIVAINLEELHGLYHPDTDFIAELEEQTPLTDVSHIADAPWHDAVSDPRESLLAVFASPMNHFFCVHQDKPSGPLWLSYCPLWFTMQALFTAKGWPWPKDFVYEK